MQAAPRISKRAVSLTARLQRMRAGPASFKLPDNVRSMEMEFARQKQALGARLFTKSDLPSIMYCNPNLEYKELRPDQVEQPTLKVHYDDGSTKTIDLKRKSHESILNEVLALFGKPAAPTSSALPFLSSKKASEEQQRGRFQPHPNSAVGKALAAEKAKARRSPTATTQSKSSASRTSKKQSIPETPPPPPAGELERGVDNGTARE